jgi:hypothetical protein
MTFGDGAGRAWKRAEQPASERSWLGVRDGFRNWLIRAV